MAISDAMLPEFDHEMANTRKTLERVPEDRFDWKPHEQSHPPSRPAWCLPASQRHSGARHLWSLCRRRRNVVKTQRSHPQKRLCENANCNGMRSVPLPLEQFKLDRQILLGILAKVVNAFDTF